MTSQPPLPGPRPHQLPRRKTLTRDRLAVLSPAANPGGFAWCETADIGHGVHNRGDTIARALLDVAP